MLKQLSCVVVTGLVFLSTCAVASSSTLDWPLKHPQLLQEFGITEFAKAHPDIYHNGAHFGIDVTEYFGAPVLAAAYGKVIAVNEQPCPNYSNPMCNFGYGNWVLIWHEDWNTATMYAHLSGIPSRKVGEIVAAGYEIGNQGASGNIVGGSHLHFSVYEGPVEVYKTQDDNIDFWILGPEKHKNPLELLPPLPQ